MVQVGARLPQQDADFISRLRIDGAATPSDKLRAIVAEARRRHEGAEDFAAALELARDQLAPLMQRLQRSEFEAGIHSELLLRLLDWLPDTLAYLTSRLPPVPEASKRPLENTERALEETERALTAFERGAADRVFRLLEVVLQLAVTRRPQCYDQALFERRMPPVLELARIIDQARHADSQER